METVRGVARHSLFSRRATRQTAKLSLYLGSMEQGHIGASWSRGRALHAASDKHAFICTSQGFPMRRGTGGGPAKFLVRESRPVIDAKQNNNNAIRDEKEKKMLSEAKSKKKMNGRYEKQHYDESS